MAIQTLKFPYVSDQGPLTVHLYDISGVQLESQSGVEEGNTSVYEANFENQTGVVRLVAFTGSGSGTGLEPVYTDMYDLDDIEGIFLGRSEVNLDPAHIRDSIGLSSADLDVQLEDIPTVSEFNNRTLPSGDYITPTDVWTHVLTESYAGSGEEPTATQALYETLQSLTNFAISGTTIHVFQRDGNTVAITFEMDDASQPTQRKRET